MDTIKADKTLDAKGLACPMPLLKAKKAMETLESGQVLEVLGTDGGSKIDLPVWCERVGHAFLVAKRRRTRLARLRFGRDRQISLRSLQ